MEKEFSKNSNYFGRSYLINPYTFFSVTRYKTQWTEFKSCKTEPAYVHVLSNKSGDLVHNSIDNIAILSLHHNNHHNGEVAIVIRGRDLLIHAPS